MDNSTVNCKDGAEAAGACEGSSAVAGAPSRIETLRRALSESTPPDIVVRYAGLIPAAALADFGEYDRNLVVLDTETTGLSYSKDELTQIAAARMERGEITEWFVTFVNPGRFLTDDIVHLTGITEDDLMDAPTPEEALAQLVEFVGDAKIVAHNADFDRHFVTNHPEGYPLLENQWIDSLDLARIALPRLKSHRLLDIARAFGAPPSTHRADADVVATCAIIRILFAAVEAMPKELVCRIARLAPVEQWPTGAVFAFFAERACARSNEAAAGSGSGGPDGPGPGPSRGLSDPDPSPDPDPALSDAFGDFAELRLFDTPENVEFSLRAMRRARVTGQAAPVKPDAAVLAANPAKPLKFPSEQEIASAFSAGGLVGRLYGSYETRPEQLAMAQAVRGAFEANENLIVEAGTGVGKSMAYLVPAVLFAKRNGIGIGIATKTNALLDQLVYHELPALAAGLGEACDLRAVPLKGMAHYPCLRRIERMLREELAPVEFYGKLVSPAPALAALLSYIEQSEYDDLDGLKIDYRALPKRKVTTTSNECLRRKCPFFGAPCFVFGARRRAEQADVVVTNHALLFCDLAADGGLLPPIRYWVIDEAHGTEAEARSAFSVSLEAEEILRLSNRVGASEPSRNPFVRAERTAVVDPVAAAAAIPAAPAPEMPPALDLGPGLAPAPSAAPAPAGPAEALSFFYALTAKARAQGAVYADAADAFTAHMKDLLFFDDKKRAKSYETVDMWINDGIRESGTFLGLATHARAFAEAAEKLSRVSLDLVAFLEYCENAAAVQRDIAATAMELKDQAGAVGLIFGPADERYVYAATLNRKKDRRTDSLSAYVMNVGDVLGETLYARNHSVVMASATITAGGSFDAFEHAVGLNAGGSDTERDFARTLMLDSSFDFDRHMMVLVPSDIPDPREPGYLPALKKLLVAAQIAQGGSMLTLFTNRREMESCYEDTMPALKDEGLRLVCQKKGVSVKGLRDDFLADETLSLYALKSFWEGFDAPGSTLKGVCVTRLPFTKPSDPLSCERAARDRDAWRHYDLPAAIIEVRQAVGRLIRTASDRGVVILADSRLATKSYGRIFLRSLPSRNVHICTCDEAVRSIREFWGRA